MTVHDAEESARALLDPSEIARLTRETAGLLRDANKTLAAAILNITKIAIAAEDVCDRRLLAEMNLTFDLVDEDEPAA